MYKVSISPEEMEKLPLASFPGKITVIDRVGLDFFKAIGYLMRQKVIGFDTESRPCFSPNQPQYGVSLLQLSGEDQAFLFRIKLMGGIPRLLCRILADGRILKIGAAVRDDVLGLEKHHNFTPRGFVDLQKIVWEYGIKDKSVKRWGPSSWASGFPRHSNCQIGKRKHFPKRSRSTQPQTPGFAARCTCGFSNPKNIP